MGYSENDMLIKSIAVCLCKRKIENTLYSSSQSHMLFFIHHGTFCAWASLFSGSRRSCFPQTVESHMKVINLVPLSTLLAFSSVDRLYGKNCLVKTQRPSKSGAHRDMRESGNLKTLSEVRLIISTIFFRIVTISHNCNISPDSNFFQCYFISVKIETKKE